MSSRLEKKEEWRGVRRRGGARKGGKGGLAGLGLDQVQQLPEGGQDRRGRCHLEEEYKSAQWRAGARGRVSAKGEVRVGGEPFRFRKSFSAIFPFFSGDFASSLSSQEGHPPHKFKARRSRGGQGAERGQRNGGLFWQLSRLALQQGARTRIPHHSPLSSRIKT